MEICRCEEYRDIVVNFKITAACTKLPLPEIQPVPDEVCVQFVPVKTSPFDLRIDKAILVPNLKYLEEQKQLPQEPKKISTKWIPVSSAVSLKLTNEGVGSVKAPYIFI